MISLLLSLLLFVVVLAIVYWIVSRLIIGLFPASFHPIIWAILGLLALVVLYYLVAGAFGLPTR